MKRGMALPLALFTLALLGGLVVGGAFVTRRATADAEVVQRASDLEPLAERAIVEVVSQWDSASRTQQPIGSVAAAWSERGGVAETDAWITRIGERTYWIFAEARAQQYPALHRRIGLVLRIIAGAPAPIPERAWSDFP